MKLNLREIPEGITNLVVDQPGGSPDLPGFSHIHGQLTVDRSGSVLKISGSLDYQCRLECSRCLRIFTFGGHEEVEIYYRPLEARDRSGGEHTLNADDLSVITYTGNEVDLWPVLLETMKLSLPLKPLCLDDCRGLCPGCGRDLNHEDCICPAEEIDPRWQGLLDRMPKNGLKGPRRRPSGGG